MTRLRLGIVGGGQLARMLAQAAISLDVDIRILASQPDEAAALICPDVVLGELTNAVAVRKFADGCDAVTFDHELIPAIALDELSMSGVHIAPGVACLRIAKNKLKQRRLFADAGLAQPRCIEPGQGDLLAAVEEMGEATGWPVAVKLATGGYDGRGVWMVYERSEAVVLADELDCAPHQFLVEEGVDLVAEMAIIVVRNRHGDVKTYPLVRTVQENGMCRRLEVPSGFDEEVIAQSEEIGRQVAQLVDVEGILAVELFLTRSGEVLINEIATRPHNSGHWTIEGAHTSQFENHVRATLGLALGATNAIAPAICTVNVVGLDDKDLYKRLNHTLKEVPEASVHLYGKAARAGRKLGHVTVVGGDLDAVEPRAQLGADLLVGAVQPAD